MAAQNTPSHTLALARSIAARTRRERALRVGARASAVGGLVGGALLVVSTQTPEWHGAAPFIAGGVLLCATVAGLAIGWRRPVSLASSAGRADAIENLHDRLTSAVELAEPGSRASRTGPSAPFAELLIAEAEERAPGVRAASIVPIGLGRAWFIGIAACAVGAAGWATIPVRTPATTPAFATERTSPEDRRDASDALDETIDSIGSGAREASAGDPEPDALDPLADQLTDQLTDIRDRLERGELDADDALAKAADELEAAAQRTEPSPTEDAAQSIAEAAENLDGEISDESTELVESLAAGDLNRARDAARNLFDRLDEMPPEARARIAEDLAKLAETLDERPDFDGPDSLQDPATDPASADRELVDALRDQLGDVRDPERVAEALEQEGLDPASARDLADRIAAREAEREARENTRRDLEQLRDALDAASRDVAENTPQTEKSPDQATEGTPEQSTEQPAEKPTAPENRPDPSRDTPASEQSQTEKPKPGADRKGEPKPDANGVPKQDANGDPKPDTNGEPKPDPNGTRGEETTQKSPSETTGSNEGTPKTEPGEGAPERSTERPADQPDASPSDQPDANSPIKRESKDGADGADGGAKPTERTDNSTEDGAAPAENRGTDPNGTPKPDGPTPEGGPSANEKTQPGEIEPGQGEPRQGEPGQGEPGQGEPGKVEPGQSKPGQAKPGQGEPGQGDPSGNEPATSDPDQGNGADGPGNPGEGRERLRRELDRLADRQNQRTHDAQRARELRDQAQRLLERASPEEREEMLDAARRMAQDAQQSRTPGQPGELGQQSPTDRPRYDAEAETVDARDRNAQPGADRVLSEWFNPDGTAPEGVARAARSAEALRQAADSAERAVEQQRVPPRYRRLVRDVFKRMKDRADSAAPAPAELGEDAGKNGGGNNDTP